MINDTIGDDAAAGGTSAAPGAGLGHADGGGVYLGGGTFSVVNSTIADNDVAIGGTGGGLDVVAGTAILNNTIVALNTNGTGSGAPADDIAGSVDPVSGYDLIGTGGSGGLVAGNNGNQVDVANPGLDPNGLQDNGGPTPTIALVAGSPAIDAGSNALAVDAQGNPLLYDQRGPGYPRIVNGTVDIGAFEYSPPLTVTAIAAVSPDPRNTPVSSVLVTLNEMASPGGFGDFALTLTDDGGPNLITGGVTVTLNSPDTYEITGLGVLTAAQGLYTFTVDAGAIQDPYGHAGTGSMSISWLMDTTPPTTAIAVPATATSLSFPVTVTGTVPAEPAGSPAVEVTSFAVYVSTNGGPWTPWQTLTPAVGTPDTATATFTGASNTIYSFYSVATDNAGNTGAYKPTVQASVDLPSLNTPVTRVASSSTYNGDGTFTLNLSGTDAGGNGLAFFEVYVAIGAGTPVPIGPTIPAGVATGGTYTASTTFVMPSADYGSSNTYRFYSVGIDAAGLQEPMHALYDVILTESYNEPAASRLALSRITVENGAAERSYVRHVGLDFNDATPSVLQTIVDSVNGGSDELTLTHYDLTGQNDLGTVSLKGLLSVVDGAIEIDFGVKGIGGNAGTTAADGYYALTFAPPAGGGQGSTHHFDRLLGDVVGSGTVDQLDLADIAAARGQSVGQIAVAIGQPASGLTPLSMDVNGDGVVNNTDLLLATSSRGRSLANGLPLG